MSVLNKKKSIYLIHKKGFSLIELLIVITLMGIISAIATISYVGGSKEINLKKGEVIIEGFLNEMRLKAFTNAKPYKVYLENINTEGEDNISIFVHEPDGTAWYDFALTRRCDCQVGSINSPSNDCNNSFRTTLVGATEIESKTIEKIQIHKCNNTDCSSSTAATINICFLPDGSSTRDKDFKLINNIEDGEDKIKKIHQTGYVE
tara:strand:+ start:191 stop:805 length:615 start_codon:yes stop_codon:yes gene_type:complete